MLAQLGLFVVLVAAGGPIDVVVHAWPSSRVAGGAIQSGRQRAGGVLPMRMSAGGQGKANLQTAGLEPVADTAEFKQGSELFELRRQAELLERRLKYYERNNKREDAASVRKSLEETYRRDPLAVYKDFRKRMWEAAKLEDYDMAANLRDAAREVQAFLPQYNLEGLWMGNYGAHGYEVISISYENSRGQQWLVATKVTGDDYVKAGEVTFKVDLTPGTTQPPPLSVNVKGKEVELEAFGGLGVIAEKGGRGKQMVSGKLILFEEARFAFVWEPLGAHITFARADEGIVRHIQATMAKED